MSNAEVSSADLQVDGATGFCPSSLSRNSRALGSATPLLPLVSLQQVSCHSYQSQESCVVHQASSGATEDQDNAWSSSTGSCFIPSHAPTPSSTSRSRLRRRTSLKERDYIGLAFVPSSSSDTGKRARFCLEDVPDERNMHSADNLRGSDLKLGPPGAPCKSHAADAGLLNRAVGIPDIISDMGGDMVGVQEEDTTLIVLPNCPPYMSHEAQMFPSGFSSEFIKHTAETTYQRGTAADDFPWRHDGHANSRQQEADGKSAWEERLRPDASSVSFKDDKEGRYRRIGQENGIPIASQDAKTPLVESLKESMFQSDAKGQDRSNVVMSLEHNSSHSQAFWPDVGPPDYFLSDQYGLQQPPRNRSQEQAIEQAAACFRLNKRAGTAVKGIVPVLTNSSTSPKIYFSETNDTMSHAGRGVVQSGKSDLAGVPPGWGREASADIINNESCKSQYASLVAGSRNIGENSWQEASRLSHTDQSSKLRTAESGYSAGDSQNEVSRFSKKSANLSDQEARQGSDVVGWPPVNSYRKNSTNVSCLRAFEESGDFACAAYARTDPPAASSNPLLIKVQMDGAPYMRKVDLKAKNGYQDLCVELEALFQQFAATPLQAAAQPDPFFQSKMLHFLHGPEYVLTYEDSEGDWMLAGDTPWEIFSQSARKIRIMKRSAVGDLAIPRIIEEKRAAC